MSPNVPIMLLAAAFMLGAAPPLAMAKDDDPAGAIPAREVTRQDVARSYREFEEKLLEARPQGAARAYIVQQFDWIGNLIVFRGDLAAGLQGLDDLADMLRAPASKTPEDRSARAIRVDIEPAVLVVGSEPAPANLKYTIRPFRQVTERPVQLSLRLRRLATDSDQETTIGPLEFGSDGSEIRIAQSPPPRPGHYVVEVVTPGGNAWPCGEWDVLEQDPRELRKSLLERLEAVEADGPALLRSRRAARSRVLLLTDRPDRSRSASFLANQYELSRQLPEEVAALERGEDPYVNRPGDYWRTIDALEGPPLGLPARIYAPESALTKSAAGETVPLVIALHGAGGDENLFMEGYGAGEIRRQADKHGFILVSPATMIAMTDLRSLPEIVATAEALYRVDPDRVYVVGHSLGAMTAGLWAGQQPDRIAGVGLIAGGQPDVQLFPEDPAKSVPVPAFVAAAEYDTIFPPRPVEASAAKAVKNGANVQFKHYEGEGHVTIASVALEDAFEWLLAQRVDPQPMERRD